MAVSSSVRRSLRRVPAFRSLPARELDTMTGHMLYKEYCRGEVIWRTRAQTDFVAIVQHGEIKLEHRIYGSVVRTSTLSAGDVFAPRKLSGNGSHSILLARAATDARLCILPLHRFRPVRPAVSPARSGARLLWRGLWLVMIVLLTVIFSWKDLTRIASGVLYAAATRPDLVAQDEQRSMRLLEYAENIDRGAVYAYLHEGYIWFQRADLQQAEAAFMQALSADRANGAALNNQAVTHFATGQMPQAAMVQKEAARYAPDSAAVQYNLGILLMKADDHVGALRAFKDSSFIDPEWAMPHLQQAFIYLENADYVNAETAARRAVELDSSQQSAHVVLTIALYNLGRNREALPYAEQAVRMQPDDRISSFYRARILIRLGEFERGLSLLEKLRKTAGDAQEMARLQAEIEALQRYLQTVPSRAW